MTAPNAPSQSSTPPSPGTAWPRPPYKLLIGVGLALVVLTALSRFWQTPVSSEPLRRFHAVPPFSLTERSNKTITNADLRGKIWIADFIFTTCPGPCPIISANMEHLQEQFKSDPSVKLVSFTVDPDDDTPAVLSTYADRHHADPNKWLFLTGKEADIHTLMSDGFSLVVSDNRGQPLQPGQFLFTHSTQLVLIDSQGIIRDYMDGTDSQGTLTSDMAGAVHQLENE